MIGRVDELTQMVAQTELLKKEAEIKMLQAQINPHFLYNTLETMCMLATLNDDHEVADIGQKLGKLLRYSLSKTKDVSTLGEELENVRHYLDIHKVRMGDKLQIDFRIDEEALQLPCPRFILQPLVENSLLHGFKNLRGPANLRLEMIEQAAGVMLNISDNGTDLTFIEISMEDEDANPVRNANNRVTVEVAGAGRLIGLDNGDSTDYDPYKGTSRRLFSGKAMAIVAANTTPGTIVVKVSSKGMESQSITLKSRSVDQGLTGVSAQFGNREMPIVMGTSDEIPVRKIEIISLAGQQLTAEHPEIQLEAKLYPANTSYTEVEWSVVNDAGIPSNLAQIEADGHRARLRALGDGRFRVRCTSRNGTDKIKLISELEFQATGLGEAQKDPYSFISAGLYDYSFGEIGNGNERGVATSRDGESRIGFRNLDFGLQGSDEITLPIFALTSEPYLIQIWEGMPGEEGSEQIAEVIYQKETRWNVYQEATFRLNKRLRGITSICFVLKQKIHLKGFSFTRQNRALLRNAAADCDHIYGDSFRIEGNNVEGIGNNVSLEMKQLDFEGEGASKLLICGHSLIDKNTIHVQFTANGKENRQLIEFTQTDGYEVKEFPLNRVTGVQDVTFIFLPGSNFDFSWFQFVK